jgi:hypothetical protein
MQCLVDFNSLDNQLTGWGPVITLSRGSDFPIQGFPFVLSSCGECATVQNIPLRMICTEVEYRVRLESRPKLC